MPSRMKPTSSLEVHNAPFGWDMQKHPGYDFSLGQVADKTEQPIETYLNSTQETISGCAGSLLGSPGYACFRRERS
jgi:hypothetical protein